MFFSIVHPDVLPREYLDLLEHSAIFDPNSSDGFEAICADVVSGEAQLWMFEDAAQTPDGKISIHGYGVLVTEIHPGKESRILFVRRMIGKGFFKCFDAVMYELEQYAVQQGCDRIQTVVTRQHLVKPALKRNFFISGYQMERMVSHGLVDEDN